MRANCCRGVALAVILLVAPSPLAVGAETAPSARAIDYRLEIESQNRYRRNFRLSRDRDSRLVDSDNEVRLGARYRAGDRVVDGVITLIYGKQWNLDQGGSDDDGEILLDTLWYRDSLEDNDDLEWSVGRQRIKEPREWWWDAKLDSALIEYRDGPWEGFAAVALDRRDPAFADARQEPEERDVFRVLSRLGYRYSAALEWDAFITLQRDRSGVDASGTVVADDREDEFDADLEWFGLRAGGRVYSGSVGLRYWIDGGMVRGRETVVDYDDAGPEQRVVDDYDRRRVSGWALDAGLTLQSGSATRVHAGYGKASGDRDPEDNRDTAYRQTGLQDNDARLATPARIRLYGELLDPEFSNLEVAMLGVGRSIGPQTSVDVFYRRYRQDRPDQRLQADLRADPNGVDADLGSSLEAVLHHRWSPRAELTVVAGLFNPGRAFRGSGNRDDVGFFQLELELTF